MKQRIADVDYDTERDKEVIGQVLCEEDGAFCALRETAKGNFYVLRVFSQLWDDGEWKRNHGPEHMLKAGIATLPSPRTRLVETIRPVIRAEAVKWWVQNFAPNEFKRETLQALGQWLAYQDGRQC